MKRATKIKVWLAVVVIALIAVAALWFYFVYLFGPAAKSERAADGTEAEVADEEFESVRIDPNAHPGVNFVTVLADVMEEQVDRGIWGWRPNNMIVGGLIPLDNVENYQLGVRDIVLKTTENLNERMAKPGGGADEFDKNVKEAKELFSIDPTSFKIPDAQREYDKGISALRRYAEGLKTGTADFQARSDNLAALLTALRRELASSFQVLIKDVEEDGTSVSMFETDDYYYQAKGAAHAMHKICQVVAFEFEEVLRSRNATKMMNELIQSLASADDAPTPWIVLDGDSDDCRANHRRHLAAEIGEAQLKIVTLEENLAK